MKYHHIIREATLNPDDKNGEPTELIIHYAEIQSIDELRFSEPEECQYILNGESVDHAEACRVYEDLDKIYDDLPNLRAFPIINEFDRFI